MLDDATIAAKALRDKETGADSSDDDDDDLGDLSKFDDADDVDSDRYCCLLLTPFDAIPHLRTTAYLLRVHLCTQ